MQRGSAGRHWFSVSQQDNAAHGKASQPTCTAAFISGVRPPFCSMAMSRAFSSLSSRIILSVGLSLTTALFCAQPGRERAALLCQQSGDERAAVLCQQLGSMSHCSASTGMQRRYSAIGQ